MPKEDIEPALEEMRKDISHIRRDMDMIKASLLPTEKISDKERAELRQTIAEMEAGKKTRLEDVEI